MLRSSNCCVKVYFCLEENSICGSEIMAIPPSFSTGIPSQLMSEEDIRQYFVRNGGVVRNTDIVNYFRTYLSNPAIKGKVQ